MMDFSPTFHARNWAHDLMIRILLSYSVLLAEWGGIQIADSQPPF